MSLDRRECVMVSWAEHQYVHRRDEKALEYF